MSPVAPLRSPAPTVAHGSGAQQRCGVCLPQGAVAVVSGRNEVMALLGPGEVFGELVSAAVTLGIAHFGCQARRRRQWPVATCHRWRHNCRWDGTHARVLPWL